MSEAKQIVMYLSKACKSKDFDFHCYEKNSKSFIVYGRCKGRPSEKLNNFLANIELEEIYKLKIESHSYDRDNTCLCITLSESKKTETFNSPRRRLRALSDSPCLTMVPISCFEQTMIRYYDSGNYAAAKEVYDNVVANNMKPTNGMICIYERVNAFIY